jgi:hypothetical protein
MEGTCRARVGAEQQGNALNPFSKVGWRRVHWLFVRRRLRGTSKSRSLERWALRFMHRPPQLNYIARAIARDLAAARQSACVRLDSVWIDGTPQARFKTASRSSTHCELGDLLVVVDRFELRGGVLTPFDSHAVIVQAKLATRHDTMPGGISTANERDLLERADLPSGIALFAGTGRRGPIGTFYLPGSRGLRPFATFLLMPERSAWSSGHAAPFVCGWPEDRSTQRMEDQHEYVEMLKAMCRTPVYGALLHDSRPCEWTRMVRTLLKKYDGVQMKGYGRQMRMYRSATQCTVASAGAGHVDSRSTYHRSEDPPKPASLWWWPATFAPSLAMIRSLRTHHGAEFAGARSPFFRSDLAELFGEAGDDGDDGGDGDGRPGEMATPGDDGGGPAMSVMRVEVVLLRDEEGRPADGHA